MPAVIVDQPWPPDAGEDLRRPDGSPLIDPLTGRPFRVLNDQLVVWVCLAPRRMPAPTGLQPFPVVLDTGFTNTFLMQQEQAEAWASPGLVAGLTANRNGLPLIGGTIRGRDADLWLFPNVPGTRNPDPAGSPVRLELPKGAWLSPPNFPGSKEKPLLGLRAIAFNRLTVHIDGLARTLGIDTP